MKFNLRKLTEDKELSLYSVSKTTGISYPALHNILNNKTTRADLETLQKLCDCLNCEINELLIKE